jgi:serine/threonine protein kinase
MEPMPPERRFSPDRWARIEQLLDRCLELPAADRAALLERARADDAQLCRDVEELLAADTRAQGPLDAAADELFSDLVAAGRRGSNGSPATADEADETAPGQIGPYRIVEEIGHGGMGVVFLAERADGQFEQRVALKLVRGGLDSPESKRRFLQERQILARLQHPNIAVLLDGGVTPDGLPYFAMEYVAGEPLTRYCDERRMDLRRRIELFLSVCDAVQHAHQSLVVHRDLKPANILVTATGEVKLLDFGIAALLEHDDAFAQQTQQMLRLTPEYASPEQLRAEPVTTATDVYNLGLILYDLLTGCRPHAARSSSLLALQHAILEQDPLPPSRTVRAAAARGHAEGARPAESGEEIAARRATTPLALERHLRGDLDNILLMTLRREPRERYASAEALRHDLDRYLTHQPVTASGGSTAYRLRKYYRRHRASMVALAAVFASLVAGLLGMNWQARRAARERDRARQAEARAVAINEFLVDEMLEGASPEQARGRELTVHEVLGTAARRVEQAFAGDPALEASLRETIGQTYSALGDYEAAQAHLERSVAILTATRGEEDPQTLAAAALLGQVLARRGDYVRASAILTTTLERQRRLLGGEHLDTLGSEGMLAGLLISQGEYLAAERRLRPLIEQLRRLHPEEWHLITTNGRRLAGALDMQRKSAEAEAVCRETLALQREKLGADHPDVSGTMELLASILMRLDRFAESVRLEEEVFARNQRVLGEEHPGTLRSARVLSNGYWQQGKPARAESLARRTVEVSTRVLGPEHPETVSVMTNLGIFLRYENRLGEAERIYRQVLDINRRTLGEEHPSAIKALKNLNILLLRAGREREAAQVTEQIIAVSSRVVARPDCDATALNDFAWFLLEGDLPQYRDPARALQLAERAVTLSEHKQIEFLDTLSHACQRTGDLARAIAIQREAMALPDAVHRNGLEAWMIQLLEQAGDPAAVEDFLRENLKRRRELRSPDDLLIAMSLRLLGRHELQQRRFEEARRQFAAAMEQFRKTLPEAHWQVARARNELGAALLGLGRTAEAETLLVRSCETLTANPAAVQSAGEEAIERVIGLYELLQRPERVAFWQSRRGRPR